MSQGPPEQKKEILSVIQSNMHREDFAQYMNYCVKKWKRLEIDLEIIDAIMASICKQWSISKEELIADKKFSEPRAMMFYVIKKQIKLSYGEIGEMFRTSKSYIHKAVDDIAILIENGNPDGNEIIQPSKNEQLILTARGHTDNENVMAARHILEQRGISWENVVIEKNLVVVFKCIQNELSEKNIMASLNGGIKS